MLRIGGGAMRDDLAAEVGTGTIDELLAAGLVKAVGARVALTPAGRDHHQQALADQLDDPARQVVQSGYERFLPINAEVLQLCTDWQLRQVPGAPPELNDHSDADYDAAVVERLGRVLTDARSLLDDLSAVAPRFAAYRDALAGAVERVQTGDSDYLTNPRVRCFHTAWFELHEDLLATLGIERTEET
jgi:hypothetical protein